MPVASQGLFKEDSLSQYKNYENMICREGVTHTLKYICAALIS